MITLMWIIVGVVIWYLVGALVIASIEDWCGMTPLQGPYERAYGVLVPAWPLVLVMVGWWTMRYGPPRRGR